MLPLVHRAAVTFKLHRQRCLGCVEAMCDTAEGSKRPALHVSVGFVSNRITSYTFRKPVTSWKLYYHLTTLIRIYKSNFKRMNFV